MKDKLKKYKVLSKEYSLLNTLYFLLFLLFGTLCSIDSSAQGSWTQKATFPGMNRDFPFSFSIGNKGYVGCGQDTLNNVVSDFWEYDPATNTWAQKANFGGLPRWTATGFSIGNKGYAGLGSTVGNSTIYQDFWEYDPATNIWTQKANFGGGNRFVAIGFVIDTLAYVGTGISINNDLWQYSPATNLWIQKSNMPTGTTDANSFAIGTNGYVMGGCYNTNLWQYNSLANTWTQKANLPANGRCDAAAFAICDKGYWGTGELGGSYGSDLWLYDPPTNTWVQKANFPGTGRDEPAYFVIGGKAYIGVGSHDGFATGVFYNDFWEFTPDSTCSACLLTANFVSSDTTFCSETGQCISFTDLSACNPTSWHWLFPGATPDTSDQQNPTNICYFNPGTYPVTLIVADSSGSDTLAVNPLIIFANLPPPPTINVIGGDTLISSHGAAYQWYLNGSPIGGATDSFYVAHQGGTYSVQITNGLGCTSLSSGVFITEVFNNQNLVEGVKLYPNPAGDELIISHNSLISNMEIYNVFGEKVFAQSQTSNLPERIGTGKPQTIIDVSGFSDGIYFLRINCNNQKTNLKFVVMHK